MKTLPRLMLFLGSGVSRPSGMPSTEDLTDFVLSGGECFRHTDGMWFFQRPPEWLLFEGELGQYYAHVGAQIERRILRQLRDFADEECRAMGFRCTGKVVEGLPSANYEELFWMVDQLIGSEQGNAINPLVLPAAAFLRSVSGACSEPGDYWQLLNSAMCLIEDAVIHKLAKAWECDNIQGLEVIRDLATCGGVGRLDIATLNHDILVERFLAKNDIAWNDGFGPLPEKMSHIRLFDTVLDFAESERVSLCKIHGSLDWYYMRGRDWQDSRLARVTLEQVRDPMFFVPEQGDVWARNKRPVFLTGNENKHRAYTEREFGRLWRWFCQMLERNQVVIVSGFGWGDRQVRRALLDWAQEDSEHRLVVLRQEKDREALDLRLHHEQGAERITFIDKYLCDLTSGDDLLGHL